VVQNDDGGCFLNEGIGCAEHRVSSGGTPTLVFGGGGCVVSLYPFRSPHTLR
jgi:hypothetical protein